MTFKVTVIVWFLIVPGLVVLNNLVQGGSVYAQETAVEAEGWKALSKEQREEIIRKRRAKAGPLPSSGLPPGMIRFHDDLLGAWCWLYTGTREVTYSDTASISVTSSLSCIPDSALTGCKEEK